MSTLDVEAILESQGIHPDLLTHQNRSLSTTHINARLPRRGEIAFDGVPMFRGLALALLDARVHGKQRFTVFSGDRRDRVIRRFNRRNHTTLHSQKQLYDLWIYYSHKYGPAGAISRGVYPANPPTEGSHLLIGDGVIGRVGQKLAWYKLGLDIVSAGEQNSCKPLTDWLAHHGNYHVARPYHSGAEEHHMIFLADPTPLARKRMKGTKAGR